MPHLSYYEQVFAVTALVSMSALLLVPLANWAQRRADRREIIRRRVMPETHAHHMVIGESVGSKAMGKCSGCGFEREYSTVDPRYNRPELYHRFADWLPRSRRPGAGSRRSDD